MSLLQNSQDCAEKRKEEKENNCNNGIIIDYCLAQTVALSFWAMMQEDYEGAWARYMAYTRQGGSQVFTKLLENAGMPSPFDGDTLRRVCDTAMAWLEAYDLTGIE